MVAQKPDTARRTEVRQHSMDKWYGNPIGPADRGIPFLSQALQRISARSASAGAGPRAPAGIIPKHRDEANAGVPIMPLRPWLRIYNRFANGIRPAPALKPAAPAPLRPLWPKKKAAVNYGVAPAPPAQQVAGLRTPQQGNMHHSPVAHRSQQHATPTENESQPDSESHGERV